MAATFLLSFLLAAAPQAMVGMDHETAPTCPATAAPLPPEFKGWVHPAPVRAGGTMARATMLRVGKGAVAALLPTSKVTYAVRPEKPGGSVSSGGLFIFDVASAGRYRVALGSAAWIDVLAGTVPAASVAHGHGPECSGVRKMVDFDLQPGRYLLQVAGNGSSTLPLMVAHVP